MKVNTDPCFFTESQIKEIEQFYNATYVCETSVKLKGGGWSYNPCAIFYVTVAHPRGSNYFAISLVEGHVYISDALPSIQEMEPIPAVHSGGEVIYSRYRHDYRTTKDGKCSIDGGRDYTRISWDGDSYSSCMLKFDKDKLVVW